jgi:xylulokinase
MKKELFIGIDLGTSSVKTILVDTSGVVLQQQTRSYPIYYPSELESEQNPLDWYNETISAMKALLEGVDTSLVKGISFGGQMHGLVILDKNNEVIRPAILWNDRRTFEEVKYLNEVIGKEKLMMLTGNIAYAGFTAPKILWVKKHEPDNFKRIAKILLPKDYLVYRFTSCYSTDYSDASGMLLLDVKNKKYSKEMCEICGINESMLPILHESYDVVSAINENLAKELGLPSTVQIIAGAGDNAAAAIGTGCANNNACNISLGTSGTVFIAKDSFITNEKIHSFCHANGKYHLMGCILSAGSSNKWWVEHILNSDFAKENADVGSTQSNGIYFLPYLMGERCPHNDVFAKGAFIGLDMTSTRKQMTRAILEGISFALKDCLSAMDSLNLTKATLCGGGSKDKVWAQIIADVCNIQVQFVKTEQGPGYGACLLAMVGTGVYSNIDEACRAIVQVESTISPNPNQVKLYEKKYVIYKKLYQNLKETFQEWI